MLQGLRFDLVVYTPYKAVDGLYEVRTEPPPPSGPAWVLGRREAACAGQYTAAALSRGGAGHLRLARGGGGKRRPG